MEPYGENPFKGRYDARRLVWQDGYNNPKDCKGKYISEVFQEIYREGQRIRKLKDKCMLRPLD